MAHGPFHDPEFDIDSFRASAEAWAKAGAKRLFIEWQTGPGPTVAWFPAGERAVGKKWAAPVSTTGYDEEYANYLEYRLSPRLAELARAHGLEARVLCVDQQPIQVMRMRRRELERAQAVSGHGSHH